MYKTRTIKQVANYRVIFSLAILVTLVGTVFGVFTSGLLPFYWHTPLIGLPTSADVEALVINPTTSSTLYAGTFGDGVYRSMDNGATWITATTGITLPMHIQNALAVDPFNTTTVYAGDYYGFGSGLYRSTNSGDTWSLVVPGASIRAVATSPITLGLVLVGGRYSGLYRSQDSGDTWTPISTTAGLTDTHVSVIAFGPTAPYTTYVGAAQSVFASEDGGLSWQFRGMLPSNIYALIALPLTPTVLFAGTWNDGVYTSANDGLTWTAANAGLPSGAWVTSLAHDPFTPTIIYAGTWEGQAYRSEDSGGTWSGLGYLGNVYALAVHPTARGVVFAGTSNNGLFRGSMLDHLTMEPVDSPQYVNHAFPITITARDALGFPLTGASQVQLEVVTKTDPALAKTLAAGGFNGTATLTDTTGTITPKLVTFIDGIARTDVRITIEATSDTITATVPDGPAVVSNPFDMVWAGRRYLPIVLIEHR